MRVSGRSSPSIPAVKTKQVCLQISQFSEDVADVTPDTGSVVSWSPGQHATSPIWPPRPVRPGGGAGAGGAAGLPPPGPDVGPAPRRRPGPGTGSRLGHESASSDVPGLAGPPGPAFQSVNHDSSDANVAYLSRVFSVNDDSSPAAPDPAAPRPGNRAPAAMRPGPDPDPDGLLEAQGVTVRFGGLTALDNVSFTAPGRQVTGIIGPNGAGKTTLLNVLCGFVRPDQGRLTFGRTELGRLRPHQLARLGITRTLQGVGLFRHLSVLENVMVGAQGQARAGFWSARGGLPASDRDERRLRARARDALDRVGAADLAEARPDQLAYGLRTRVAPGRG